MSTPEHAAESAEQKSSVKVSRNAKGDPQWEIKVVVGTAEYEISLSRAIAVTQYRALEAELR